MDFYGLTSFTPDLLEPFLDGKVEEGLYDEDFPLTISKAYFQNAERVFNREIRDVPWVAHLYEAAFEISRKRGMLDSLLWWPPPAPLRRILREESVLGDYKAMVAFLEARYPTPELLLNVAAVSWWRGLYGRVRDANELFKARGFLGERILKALPLVNRGFAQTLEESDFRRNAPAGLWPVAVGEMAVRVRDAEGRDAKTMQLTAADFSESLPRATVSMWRDMLEKLGKVPSALVTEPVVGAWGDTVRPNFGDVPEFGSACYILERMGVGAVFPEEFGRFQRMFSSVSAERRSLIMREGALLLVMEYAKTVARYGYICGFLKYMEDQGAGVQRAYLQGYAQAFLAEIEAVFSEELDDTELLEGTCVFRMALCGALWTFFSYDRMRETCGLEKTHAGREDLYAEYAKIKEAPKTHEHVRQDVSPSKRSGFEPKPALSREGISME